MLRYIGYGTATAAAVAVAVVLWFPGRSMAGMFDRAMENADKATSLRAKIVNTITVGGKGDPKTVEMKFYQQGERVRVESGDAKTGRVVVTDGKAGKVLILSAADKSAQWMNLPKDDPKAKKLSRDVAGMADLFKDQTGKKLEPARTETIDGRKLAVYEFKNHKLPEAGGTANLTAWIDPKTELPARFRIELTIENSPVTTDLTVLGWNEELDEKLFSTDLPAGFKFVEDKKPEPAESDSVVFINAVVAAEKATSVTATATIETGGKVTYTRKVIRASDAIRVETTRAEKSDEVIVADLKSGDAIIRDEKAKTAYTTKLQEPELRMLNGLLAELAGMKDSLAQDKDAIKPAGEEKLAGRDTKVYDITTKQGVYKVWIDPKTDLPIRVRSGEDPKTKATFVIDFADWNKEFDAKLFARDLPSGFKMVEMPKKK